MPREIELPYNWNPRPYQMPLWNAMENGCKRAICIWHRRAGKDDTGLNWTIVASQLRVGVYWHILPTYNQGRKIIWDGIDREGRPFRARFPDELLAKKPNDTEMKVTLRNGSLWQIVGSDNIGSIVGPNPVGVVLSEYALQNPQAWDYLRPILAENDGWAIFLTTPRGRNHACQLFEESKLLSNWFSQLLTVEDTRAISAEVLIQEKREMDAELFEQEYYCSFNAPLFGSYYGKLLTQAEKDGRITSIPHDPGFVVDTWWDIGFNCTAIWFTQTIGHRVHLIDYYQGAAASLDHYVKIIDEKPYRYREHWAPHDMSATDWVTGKTRTEFAKGLNINFSVATRPQRVYSEETEDVIHAAMMILPRCWFDREKCAIGLEALKSYRREYDEKLNQFRMRPLKDWASHGADAFGLLATNLKTQAERDIPDFIPRQAIADSDYDPLTY